MFYTPRPSLPLVVVVSGGEGGPPPCEHLGFFSPSRATLCLFRCPRVSSHGARRRSWAQDASHPPTTPSPRRSALAPTWAIRYRGHCSWSRGGGGGRRMMLIIGHENCTTRRRRSRPGSSFVRERAGGCERGFVGSVACTFWTLLLHGAERGPAERACGGDGNARPGYGVLHCLGRPPLEHRLHAPLALDCVRFYV